MKRLMLIGQSQCGKTSLLQRLQQQPLQYHKTQALDYSAMAIDTPGEYLEHRAMYSILITSAWVLWYRRPTVPRPFLPPCLQRHLPNP